MGGGFIYTGNSATFAAATPPFTGGAGIARSFHTHNSVAAIYSENNAYSQNAGDSIFGSVPSRLEVERAIIDLQRFMNGLSSTSKSELHGLQALLYNQNESKMVQFSAGFENFSNAFSMMQTEPAFQNMVVSISSDRAVWEAILINKAVQDIQGSISAGFASLKSKDQTEGEEGDISILILKWIMGFTKSKVLEVFDKFGLLVNEILKPKEKPNSDLLDEKVRSSLLLSLVIILIVVVTRSHD